MADCSSGPVSTLPGHLSIPPTGQCCDEHPGVPAFKRVQGETDSWSCEYLDMCTTCYEEYKNEIATIDRSGTCEMCGCQTDELRKFRDPEEGSCGRVYNVCHACAKAAISNFNDFPDED